MPDPFKAFQEQLCLLILSRKPQLSNILSRVNTFIHVPLDFFVFQKLLNLGCNLSEKDVSKGVVPYQKCYLWPNSLRSSRSSLPQLPLPVISTGGGCPGFFFFFLI